jgi:hypothetical protein
MYIYILLYNSHGESCGSFGLDQTQIVVVFHAVVPRRKQMRDPREFSKRENVDCHKIDVIVGCNDKIKPMTKMQSMRLFGAFCTYFKCVVSDIATYKAMLSKVVNLSTSCVSKPDREIDKK